MSANGEQLILENEAENGGTGNEIGTPMLDGLMIADNEQDMQTAKGNDEESNGKGNEEKKIFCGGISYDTTGEDLNAYFTQFGAVKEAQVKYDRLTGRSRGFAFVEFESIDGCKASLVSREQMIKGKQCEIKPAKTREIGYLNKKVFVGGLPGDFPEEELRKHFEQFGRVDEIEWPFDKMSKTRKNFCFVCFDSEESADRAASNPKQQFANRECDIKKAVPQNKRGGANSMLFSPRIGGNSALRGAFAGGMVASGMRNNVANHQMYQNPWYQMNATAAWF